MALRLSAAALLVLSGCLAIAWFAGSDGYQTQTYLFVPSVASQGYSQPYSGTMEGVPLPVQLPYTASQSGFPVPQQAPRSRSLEVGMLFGLVGAAVGFRVATAAVTPPLPPSTPPRQGSTRRGNPLMQLFGPKLTPEEKLEEQGYWPGEWVCADCGYIYEPGTSPPFEELRQRWKCPQCAGPRRRFVKKAGGVVAAVDDSPLLIGTALTAVVMIVLVYVGLTI